MSFPSSSFAVQKYLFSFINTCFRRFVFKFSQSFHAQLMQKFNFHKRLSERGKVVERRNCTARNKRKKSKT